MQVLIGAILGCGAGLGVWLVARWLSRPVEAHCSEQGEEPGPPPRPAGWGVVLPPAALALWGAYLGWRSPPLGQLVLALLYTGLLAALSWIDFRERRLPNALLAALLALGLAQMLLLGRPTLVAAALGLLAGGGLFLVLALLRRGAMGAGDVKFAAVLGAVLGFPLILPALLYGVLAGGVAALWLLVTRRVGRTDPMAYGPYLALGAWIVWTRAAGLWP